MSVKHEKNLEPSFVPSEEEQSADPMRRGAARERPEGHCRIWFRPARNHPGAAYRDIDPKSMLRVLGTQDMVPEMDIWRAKLADPDEMNVVEIVTEKGKVLPLGTPVEKKAN